MNFNFDEVDKNAQKCQQISPIQGYILYKHTQDIFGA